jgi:hypothetical protein
MQAPCSFNAKSLLHLCCMIRGSLCALDTHGRHDSLQVLTLDKKLVLSTAASSIHVNYGPSYSTDALRGGGGRE